MQTFNRQLQLLVVAALLATCGCRPQDTANSTSPQPPPSSNSVAAAPTNTPATVKAVSSSSSTPKWTILVYMAADNNLECFALDNMEALMQGMAKEPDGCFLSTCGSPCPASTSSMWSKSCSDGSGATGLQQFRCCPGSFPDVMVLVDRGAATCNPVHGDELDYTLIDTTWSSARELLLLPGGVWQQQREYPELDLSQASTLTDFLQRGLTRFPPSANRKYFLVLWDHGGGWQGYGVDQTCDATAAYNPNVVCGMLSLPSVVSGVAAGLVNPADGSHVVLDIIGFDACLMAMYEVATALQPYTRYLFGSELLEPGHGWDYTAVGDITAATVAAPNTGAPTAVDVANMFINTYLTLGAQQRSSGLTLALIDLSLIPQFTQQVTSAVNALTQQLKGNASQAIRILQQRSAVGVITGAETNVDMGAALSRLRSVSTSNSLSTLTTAYSSYQSIIKAFNRDNELPDGSGMGLYFPITTGDFSAQYTALSRSDAALTPWIQFLLQLYNSTSIAMANKGTFAFVEAYAVPFFAQSTASWITYGTLTSDAGLSATLMYGFAAPDGQNLMMAGSLQGAVNVRQALGAWSGYLYVLVQNLDGKQRLALVNADESRTYTSTGATQQLLLQIKAYYASSCSAAVADLQPALYKYMYNATSGQYKQQLFVSTPASGGNSTIWGEVPPQQGGVIIPYLVSIAVGTAPSSSSLSSMPSGNGLTRASFGYADCLKWGYNSTIDVAGIRVSEAAGVLGLDLTQDVVTQLLVQAVDGSATGLTGLFTPTQRTRAGCQCKQRWQYKLPDGSVSPIITGGSCVSVQGSGTFCAIEPDSCSPGSTPWQAYADQCDPVTTLSNCKCRSSYSVDGQIHYGTCHTDSPPDPNGNWCIVDRSTCQSPYRAHGFGANDYFNTSAGPITGLDWDYCQTRTQRGCFCSTSWTYAGASHNGVCVTGLPGGRETLQISNNTSWCMVDPRSCPWPQHMDGYPVDTCAPRMGRVTTNGTQCLLPVRYMNVTLYDCVAYNHSVSGPVAPWCFTDKQGSSGSCAPATCSQAIKQYCPNMEPADGSDLTAWQDPQCLRALCHSRQDQANLTRCASDAPADLTLLSNSYAFLNGSPQFRQQLAALNTTNVTLSGSGRGGLDAFCSAKYGDLCVDTIMDPACPALSRSNNNWLVSTDRNALCDLGCLKALCQLMARSTLGDSSAGRPCVDAELELYLRWDLMELMGKSCSWPTPPRLMCSKLLAPEPVCLGDRSSAAASGFITDGSPPAGNYSPGSNCTWIINSPDLPYVSLNFTRFETEALYDSVVVQDFDGILGIFSGNSTPGVLNTDTGLLQVTFTSDDSIQAGGFNASLLTSSNPQVALPNCTDGAQLVQVSLRTRQFGGEISWLVTKASTASVQQLDPLLSGGQLPSSLRLVLPPGFSSDTYKDYRSYPTYTCLAPGSYMLRLYDTYGDGWNGASITVTQLLPRDSSMGCELVRDTCTAATKVVSLDILANAATDSSVCSNISLNRDDGFYVQAKLGIGGEDTASFNLAKQRKLRDALAQLMDSDVSYINIMSILNSTVTLSPLPSPASNSSTTSRSNTASGGTSRTTTVGGNSSSSSSSSNSAAGTHVFNVSGLPPDRWHPSDAADTGVPQPVATVAVPPTRRLQQDSFVADVLSTSGVNHWVEQQQVGSTTVDKLLVQGRDQGGMLQRLLPLVTKLVEVVQHGSMDWQAGLTHSHLNDLEQQTLQQQQHGPAATEQGQCGSGSCTTADDAPQHAASSSPTEEEALQGMDAAASAVAKRKLTILQLGADGAWHKAGLSDMPAPAPALDATTPVAMVDTVPVIGEPPATAAAPSSSNPSSSAGGLPSGAGQQPAAPPPQVPDSSPAPAASPPGNPQASAAGLAAAPSLLDSQLLGAVNGTSVATGPVQVDPMLQVLLAPSAVAVAPLAANSTLASSTPGTSSRGPQPLKVAPSVAISSADFRAVFGKGPVMFAAEAGTTANSASNSGTNGSILGAGVTGPLAAKPQAGMGSSMVIGDLPGLNSSIPLKAGASGSNQPGPVIGGGTTVAAKAAQAAADLQQRLGKAEVVRPAGEQPVHVYSIPRSLRQVPAEPGSTGALPSGGGRAPMGPSVGDSSPGAGHSTKSTASGSEGAAPPAPGAGDGHVPKLAGAVNVAALVELNRQRRHPPAMGVHRPDSSAGSSGAGGGPVTQRPDQLDSSVPGHDNHGQPGRIHHGTNSAQGRGAGAALYNSSSVPGKAVNVVQVEVGAANGTAGLRPMKFRTPKKVGVRRRDPNKPHPLQQVLLQQDGQGLEDGVGSNGTHGNRTAGQQQRRRGSQARNSTRAPRQQQQQQQHRRQKDQHGANTTHNKQGTSQQQQQQQQQQQRVGQPVPAAVQQLQQQQQVLAGGGAQRLLLQNASVSTNRSRSVVEVTVRVAGYADAASATAASVLWTQIINNGSLASLMAARGWPGVRVQLLAAMEIGQIKSKGGLLEFLGSAPSALAIIVGVVIGGTIVIGGTVALALRWQWRRRQQTLREEQVAATASGLLRPLSYYRDRAATVSSTESLNLGSGPGTPQGGGPGAPGFSRFRMGEGGVAYAPMSAHASPSGAQANPYFAGQGNPAPSAPPMPPGMGYPLSGLQQVSMPVKSPAFVTPPEQELGAPGAGGPQGIMQLPGGLPPPLMVSPPVAAGDLGEGFGGQAAASPAGAAPVLRSTTSGKRPSSPLGREARAAAAAAAAAAGGPGDSVPMYTDGRVTTSAGGGAQTQTPRQPTQYPW